MLRHGYANETRNHERDPLRAGGTPATGIPGQQVHALAVSRLLGQPGV
jgi:hypothetical protein